MTIVSLTNTKQFSCPAETTILDAALAQGIVLEHSCRTGRCGACKVKVISGLTQIMKPEDSLTNEELETGYILTCARTAIENVNLDIEDLGQLGAIRIKTLPSRIDNIQKLAPDVIRIMLRLPPNSNFEYLSGQYIDVIAQKGVRRSYSIANSRLVSNKIELHIRQVNEGEMSEYWFNQAKENDLLRFEGPHGTFCFREKSQKNIIFLATGTGIAPIKSILEDLNLASESLVDKKLYIYWGGRTPQDIYWRPEFAHLNLSFNPTLSRKNTNWTGHYGYVQEALLADNIDLTDSVVYACGSDEMIHSAQKLLFLHGLETKNFYSDAFVSSK
jgi:CDP-4-dehydro-6-deoxyglucose reductase, E3